MNRRGTGYELRVLLTVAMVGAALPLAMLSAQGPAPKVTIVLKDRRGQATPERLGFVHTGGGNTVVEQPSPDTVVITMMGVAVAGPHPCKASTAAMTFELTQGVEIACADPKSKRAKLTVDTQLIGLLRGDKHGGSASVGTGTATVSAGSVALLTVALDGHAAAGCENLAINDHKGPVSMTVSAGDYHLCQGFHINAVHGRGLCGKAASAEFAPDPALDPLWISYWEPFHGVAKKDFGFKATYHVEPE